MTTLNCINLSIVIVLPPCDLGQLIILFYTINNEGEELISISGSAHLGGDGHFSLGFNVTEFMRRLFD